MARDSPRDFGVSSAGHALTNRAGRPCRVLRLRCRTHVSRSKSRFGSSSPMKKKPNKSLQATRDDAFSSAARFTSFGPACLSSGRWPE